MVASKPNPLKAVICTAALVALTTGDVPTSWADDDDAQSHRLGMMTDVGLPDGFMASVLARTSPRTRLHVGVGHNAVSMGIRGGARLHASDGATSPFLAFELGHYFDGAAQPWVRAMAEGAGLDSAQLNSLSYEFYNVSVGLRLGSPKAAFYLQAGASYISSELHLSESQGSTSPMAPSVNVFTRTTLRVWSPAARVGLIAFF